MSDIVEQNDQLLLISGKSTAGKSASLRNIPNQERWMYLNYEAGKRLPFRNKFYQEKVTDPLDTFEFFDQAINNIGDIDGIILDSITFMMEMYESVHVYGSNNTQSAWGDFQQFWKALLQDYVPRFQKPIIMIAHVSDVINGDNVRETSIPIKGALKGVGLEAYFSTNVMARRMTIKELEGFDSPLLVRTDEDLALGYKHVFQTRPTKETAMARIRSPMGMWETNETYIDNDANLVLARLNEFYN